MKFKRSLLAVAVLLNLLILDAASGASKSHHGRGPVDLTPGKFDYYVFSLSWQPAFCQSHKDKKECVSETDTRFDATNLALHGLWPSKRNDPNHNYAFCGVPGNVKHLDNAQTWCNMPAVKLSGDTADDLALYMPGYASCLENHEWYKHGTCSGLPSDNYFETATTLVEQTSTGSLGKYLTSHVGETVAPGDLLTEFEKDYGVGSRKYVNLFCD
jgi:ribonuclease T2